VLQTVADAYQPDIEDSGRTLDVDIPGGITIIGDRHLLVQLFANLVENALRHTPAGSRIALHLKAAPGASAIRAEVSDNGLAFRNKNASGFSGDFTASSGAGPRRAMAWA
jgi:signal transduction histidine kinase